MPNWLLCWDPRTPLNFTTWPSSTIKFKFSNTGHSWAEPFRLAVNNDWQLEEAWGLYLVSLSYMNQYYVTCISDNLQARISFWTMRSWRPWQRIAMSWDISACSMGCAGNRVSDYYCCLSCLKSRLTTTIFLTRHHLTFMSGARSRYPLKRPVFSSDVSVQTETVSISFHSPTRIESNKVGQLDDQESALTAADLAAILKWSKDISSDINLSAGNRFLFMKRYFLLGLKSPTALKRLTEIATGGTPWIFTVNELIIYLNFRNVGLRKYLWYANFEEWGSVWAYSVNHSGYYSRSRRPYCVDQHDTSRPMPSTRVRMVFQKNRLWLNNTGAEIQSRFGQSMILFKKPLFNIVRLPLQHRPSFWLNWTSYSLKLQRKGLLRRCFVRLPIFFWSWSNASSLCGLPPDNQQQRTNVWSCLRFVSICLFPERGHYLDSSLSTSQYQHFELSVVSFCSDWN